jgi:hypothetical protein
MPKYKESTSSVDINTWRRATHMILWNEDLPRVEIHDEDLTVLPDTSTVNKYVGKLDYVMSDPLAEIPIIDPVTFEPTEQTFTAGDFYTMAASVYLWLARQRDE